MNFIIALLSPNGLKSGVILMVCSILFCKPKLIPPLLDGTTSTLVSDQSLPTGGVDTLTYVMGKFDPAEHPSFSQVPLIYASRSGMYLRSEALEAFINMSTAATREGIHLKIISATRNFYAQKNIWEDKWNGRRLVENGQNLAITTPDPIKRALKILEYSSMPGSSRHHWGTDMDLNALENAYFSAGEGKKIYDWLVKYGHEFGFCQPYTAGRLSGYHVEKWHWSYMPVARPLTDYCLNHLHNEAIQGFDGAQTASQINIVEDYVLGINQQCK